MSALLNAIEWLHEHAWVLTTFIAVVGLGLYGLRDLMRLSPRRIWAIGDVCFRDAIRRRVLLITPLAMLGIVIVSQLQRPIDEADAIRLTIKFCFFATALVVTIIALITAATNLPREIDNRVIYTIVTKPVTRMEIAFGKLVGFARVSAAILLIMGAFSLGYLHLRAWYLENHLAQSEDAARRTPTHGLLFAQSISAPENLQQYARMPVDNKRLILGGQQQAMVDFEIPQGEFVLAVEVQVPYELVAKPATDHVKAPQGPPPISIQVLKNRTSVYTAETLFNEKPDAQAAPIQLTDPAGTKRVLLDLPLSRREALTKLQSFTIQAIGGSSDHLYQFNDDSIRLILGNESQKMSRLLPKKPPQLGGSEGRSGQELRGPEFGEQPVAIMQFRNVRASTGDDGRVPFELVAGVEASGDTPENSIDSNLEISARDNKTGRVSDPVIVHPENRQVRFFSLPPDFITDNFDLILQNRSQSQVVELNSSSISVVSSREYFGFNFFKGLLVLWLFAILVAAIAFCCSTFLSWPIAVMLTLLIILCRWGVGNLDLSGGLGRQVVTDTGADQRSAPVIESVVEGLTNTLKITSNLLPDISSFGVTEQIERGVSVSVVQVFEPMAVVLLFGIPLVTFAYVFLRNKEVAP